MAEIVDSLDVEALHACLTIEQMSIDSISGWKASINLPPEHVHRSFSDIGKLIRASELT